MVSFVDLFSGIGGFALGARWAGLTFEKHFYSEVDEYAIKVYEKNFPEAKALGDITKVNWQALQNESQDWIITGGFPCQDISVAGKGAGITGSRSSLWFEVAESIRILQPRYAIIENVAALVIRGLDRVLIDLAQAGYDASWQDIRASDMGAPHRRERLWIVAYPNRESGRLQQQPRQESSEAFRGCENVADTATERLQGAELENVYKWQRPRISGCRGQWEIEPDVGRVAHGIPSRVDRLKGLGNAIVPQIAQILFEQIGEIGATERVTE